MPQTLEQKNQHRREYYAANREKLLAQKHEYHVTHRNARNKKQREFYKVNSEYCKAYARAYRIEHREELADKKTEWRRKNILKHREWSRLSQAKNRWKHRRKICARQRLYVAIIKGKVVKPSCCSACGVTGKRIHGHHHRGYDFPLDVIWLCSKCHGKVHRKEQ